MMYNVGCEGRGGFYQADNPVEAKRMMEKEFGATEYSDEFDILPPVPPNSSLIYSFRKKDA